MSDKVTVIIPTYKRSIEILSRAIESVLGQSYENIEVVVVDDSPSSFEQRNAIKMFMTDLCKKNKKVVYHQNNKNVGGSLARNKGIELSTGEYITFLDDDDEYLPQKVEVQLEFMKLKSLDMSFSKMIMYDASGKVVDVREYNDIVSFDNAILLKYHLLKHLTGTPTFMFKSEMLRKINGFDDAKMGQEYFLMLKAIESGLHIGYLPKCFIKVYKPISGGISQGENKIKGEINLLHSKKKYFHKLNLNEKCYVYFRHYIVMAVAYKRNSQYIKMFCMTVVAFFCSPINFFSEIINFRRRINNLKN